jgi:hypothetical protein
MGDNTEQNNSENENLEQENIISTEQTEINSEEQYHGINTDAEKLIEELKQKKEEIDNYLSEFDSLKNSFTESTNEKLEGYESRLNEFISSIDTTKNDFINDVDQKLIEYKTKFEETNDSAETFKADITQKLVDLSQKFEVLTGEYSTNASQRIEDLNSKVDSVTQILKTEQENFAVFLKGNKDDFTNKYTEITNLITQYNIQTTESITKIKTNMEEAINSNAKIKQLEADVKAFKESVDEYLVNMTNKTTEVNSKTEEFKKSTQEIIDNNKKLTVDIEEQLKKATGVSLFHMFQNRREDLEKNQGWWLAGIIASIVILIIFSGWILSSIKSVPQNGSFDWFKDAIFKFTLSTPVIYLLYFLTDRYTKLRRLIEEYAFKSAISLAITPYFDLVKGLNGDTEEKDKDFLIAVIGNIFKTPTDKVFRTKEGHFDLDFSSYYKNIANALLPMSSKEKEEA